MCIATILSLFKKKPQPNPPPETPTALNIPHPEELPDYSITIDNCDLDSIFNKWMLEYNVPEQYRDFWRNAIEIEVNNTLPYPAGTWDNPETGKRHLSIKPEYLNPGVLAHEQAHNSYALLTEEQKKEFSTTYTPLKTTDPLIVYLYSKNSYGLTNDIEGHAEIFRYLCEKMPVLLKNYYPKFF